MQLGEFELTTVSGGRFRIDGGSMFGIVPYPLWSRHTDVDDRYTISQATNCLHVRTPHQHILIDTGYGAKLSDKERKNFQAEEGNPLFASLNEIGVQPDQIDLVVLTHLHFDHAGGGVIRGEDGELCAAFPNAEYVVQREEWELAAANHPELRNAYPSQNLEPLLQSGQLRMIGPDEEIVTGMHGMLTPGHTEFHQSIRMESGEDLAIYLGDLCPSSLHLPSLWCMSYDTHMIETRRTKPRVLGEIADRNGWAFFDHDPKCVAAQLERDDRRDFSIKRPSISSQAAD